MAFNYRKLVRDALQTVLSDGTNGFNAQLAAAAATYGIQPWSLDFSSRPSRTVVWGYVDDAEFDVSTLVEFPGAVIYSVEAVDERRMKPAQFSGFVTFVIRKYLRLRALDDVDTGANQPDFDGNLEKWPDATEHAILAALRAGRGTFQAAGCNHSEYRADRNPIISTGDGSIQIVNFTLGFEVTV